MNKYGTRLVKYLYCEFIIMYQLIVENINLLSIYIKTLTCLKTVSIINPIYHVSLQTKA